MVFAVNKALGMIVLVTLFVVLWHLQISKLINVNLESLVPLDNKQQKNINSIINIDIDINSFSCTFDRPPNQSNNSSCFELLSKRLADVKPRRWLFFGDSTMAQTFYVSVLKQHLMHDVASKVSSDPCLKEQFLCQEKYDEDRCKRNRLFDVPDIPENQEWVRPNFTEGEGPLVYGLYNPGCSDCGGCLSALLYCTQNPSSSSSSSSSCRESNQSIAETAPVHGGYLMMEFARDVEVQSAQFRTTQENIHSWLSSEYNAPRQVHVFGKPVCVMLAGFHDMEVPNITLPLFLHNVQWLLEMFQSECAHIVWFANTAPGDIPPWQQTRARTMEWNSHVQQLLLHLQLQQPQQEETSSSPRFRDRISYVDVYNVSCLTERNTPDDNIHMNPEFYRDLGSMIVNVIKKTRP